jgi:hypothetical protein
MRQDRSDKLTEDDRRRFKELSLPHRDANPLPRRPAANPRDSFGGEQAPAPEQPFRQRSVAQLCCAAGSGLISNGLNPLPVQEQPVASTTATASIAAVSAGRLMWSHKKAAEQ